MKKVFTFYLNHFRSSEIKITYSTSVSNTDSDVLLKAPKECVNNVLSFARSFSTMETKSVGIVEMMQN